MKHMVIIFRAGPGRETILYFELFGSEQQQRYPKLSPSVVLLLISIGALHQCPFSLTKRFHDENHVVIASYNTRAVQGTENILLRD